MRNLSGLFDYLTNCENETILKEIKIHCDRLIHQEGPEAAKYLTATTQTIYKLIKKGKLDKVEISTVDKPGTRPAVRIRKFDIEKYMRAE
jgi:excisionase family DNA binding protein